jgi:SAM-dependent methyltransferase
VRRHLASGLAGTGDGAPLLDVGGRKSHYTIGLPARVTITDVPKESAIQQQLNLGINDSIVSTTLSRRSNVDGMLYDDMTHSHLPDSAFNFVVAVEVLEHVEQDDAFVAQVNRVLRDGGQFLMTTPNGDSVANTNPDHKRHYTRAGLESLLKRYFRDVQVAYAIRGGFWRTLGLKSWSARHPLQTMLSMIGNAINGWQSAGSRISHQSVGTRHLIAIATK